MICDVCGEVEPCACCRSSETHMRKYHATENPCKVVGTEGLVDLPRALRIDPDASEILHELDNPSSEPKRLATIRAGRAAAFKPLRSASEIVELLSSGVRL